MSRRLTKTYLEQLDQFYPALCWLLARKGRRQITQAQIAKETGWGIGKVRRLCHARSWSKFSIADMDAFRIATGVTRKSERRQRWYLRTSLDLSKTASGLQHFRKHPGSAMVKAVALSTAP